MRPNFALYGAAAVALVTLATVAEATPAYESDYGHVDEYKSNNYKHEAKYPSSYESDDYKHETSGGNGHYEPHEPSYGRHYEEEYSYEEYTPSHYKPKYSMAPSYKHQPSYGSQSYKHKPSYRHKRSVDTREEQVRDQLAIFEGIAQKEIEAIRGGQREGQQRRQCIACLQPSGCTTCCNNRGQCINCNSCFFGGVWEPGCLCSNCCN